MSTADIDPTAVAIALGEPLGGQLLDGDAKLSPVAVPGVAPTVVWRVRGESGPHPWQRYVGAWPDGSVRVLTADQPAWASLIAAVGIHLADEGQARAYVDAYLEITRGAMVIVQPVDALDGLPWRPGSDQEEAARTDLLENPPEVAPRATRTKDGFHVERTLVVDRRLQRNTFDLTPAGEVTNATFEVLAEGLPLPIAR